ncbi:MAG: PQQ-binding-like beta-propeller repeat protein, partial [Planctomycetales bacterium]|nr:PQQ-binding-like beta-propeller repeat protein [Planctomycetales bacterium]
MKNSLLSLVALLLLPIVAQAENWPNWRGPGLNGVAPGEGYATEWSTTKNVDWHIALPGRGASTPIVWGDRIFLTCGIDGQNAVLCYDRSGKQLWERRLGDERAGKHKKASGSNPSAVTEGKQVFVYFKSGDLAALSFDGQVA